MDKRIRPLRFDEAPFGDVRMTLSGDRALARFTGQATHVKLDPERWTCGGDYEYGFMRTANGWKVISAKFSMRWGQGTR